MIISTPVVWSDVTHPVGRASFDFDYEAAYRTAIWTGDLATLPPVGPFYHSTLRTIMSETSLTPSMMVTCSPGDTKLRLFSIIGERFETHRDARSRSLLSLTGGIRYQFSRYFGALVLFDMDRERALNPNYVGKKWRGLAGDVETAAIYFKKDKLAVMLGRERVFWGPQLVNLILSCTAQPLDQLSIRYTGGKLAFSFLFARLDESRPDSLDRIRWPDRSFNDNRYLVGHRLDIRLNPNFRIGLFETSLFGGEGRPPELYYLNPLQFFHTIQLNEQRDDNTILGFDVMWTPFRGWAAYGQMIVDDFQVDRSIQSDQEPNELGFMAGLVRSGQPGSLGPDFKAEYTRITNRTYHQRDPRNRYLFRNELLGHPLGPDADSMSLSIRFWPSTLQSVQLEIARCRHGEGSIHGLWEEPWMEIDGEYSERFPTGVTQKGTYIAFSTNGYAPISQYFREHIAFSIQAGWATFKNRNNVIDDNNTTLWLETSISWMGFIEIDTGD